VLIELVTSTPLTNLDVTIPIPSTRLTSFALSNLVSGLATANFDPGTPGQIRLTFTALAGQSLAGTQQLARLHFTAPAGQGSAIVPLVFAGATVARQQSGLAPSLLLNSGRAVIVNGQPLLEAAGGVPPVLTLYGKTGTNYVIEATANPANAASWTPWQTVTLSNISGTYLVPGTNGPLIFYRARQ
jgi:hypothetical protein